MRSAPRSLPPLLSLAGAAACAVWGSSAFADDDVADLLDRGVELRREHRNEEALALFERAARLAPAPPTFAQMALAEQALGRWVDAARDFDAALSSGDDPWIAKNLDALVGAQAIVSRHVGWIAVQVDAAGAEVLLDGRPIPQGPDLCVTSGGAVLEVHAAGRVPDIRHVEIEPAKHARLTIALAVLAPAVPPAPTVLLVPPPADAAPASTPIIPLVLGAAGVASLATGTYFGIRTFSDKSQRDALCPVGGVCQPAAQNSDSDARSSANISTAAFITGGALVVAAGVWWLVARSDSHGDRGAIRLAPTVSPTSAGLVVGGVL
jgi:hypothetical protein